MNVNSHLVALKHVHGAVLLVCVKARQEVINTGQSKVGASTSINADFNKFNMMVQNLPTQWARMKLIPEYQRRLLALSNLRTLPLS